jgi:hypothetical protein
MYRAARWRWMLAIVAAAGGCSRHGAGSAASASEGPAALPVEAQPAAAGAPNAPAPLEPLTTPYPGGRWRLATDAELQRTLIWLSHIQISSAEATPRVASFHLPEWTPRSDNPGRSRREAYELALALAERTRAAPEEFARLARESSDDVATRDHGGALGGRRAQSLTQWPEILDAAQALGDGEISRVVETEFGFHVIVRHAPPIERRVSGARIIIGYDEAPWLHRFLARRPIPARTRADALALAETLYGRLKSHPDEFASAVEQYSDHRDAVRGGDFGEWGTREATPFVLELEILRRLEVGELARPLDSPFGVQLILRTVERTRRSYAMAKLALGFDPSLPGTAPGSLEAVKLDLARLSAQFEGHPDLFDEQRMRHCCRAVQTWVEGSGNALEEAALERLAPGEIAREPLIGNNQISLLRRMEAPLSPTPPLHLELPSPRKPDIEWVTSTYGGSKLLRSVAEKARPVLDLDTELAKEFDAVHRGDAGFAEAKSKAQKVAAFREHQRRLLQLLGASRFEQYQRVFEAHLEERLLRTERLPSSRDPTTGLAYLAWPRL